MAFFSSLSRELFSKLSRNRLNSAKVRGFMIFLQDSSWVLWSLKHFESMMLLRSEALILKSRSELECDIS